MFNFTKKSEKMITTSLRPQVLVEEIHETFNTESERLLEESRNLHAVSGESIELHDKQSRLRNLGFSNTTIKKHNEGPVKLSVLGSENEYKIATNQAIKYFTQKYPFYKFITDESIEKICKKYGLVLGSCDDFTGFVPEKNLLEMERFKIDSSDECCENRHYLADYPHSNISGETYNEILDQAKSGTLKLNYEYKVEYFCDDYIYISNSRGSDFATLKKPLKIAAPLKDFNMTDKKIEGHKIVNDVKDPVVFKPVYFNGHEFYLIVTAWGLEAADPFVVNVKMN